MTGKPLAVQLAGSRQVPVRGRRRPAIRAAAETEQKDAVSAEKREIKNLLNKPYKWGFKSEIQMESIPKGLSEDTVRLISAKKGEPDWMLDFRLRAYRKWLTMKEPEWSDNK